MGEGEERVEGAKRRGKVKEKLVPLNFRNQGRGVSSRPFLKRKRGFEKK